MFPVAYRCGPPLANSVTLVPLFLGIFSHTPASKTNAAQHTCPDPFLSYSALCCKRLHGTISGSRCPLLTHSPCLEATSLYFPLHFTTRSLGMICKTPFHSYSS